jgi:phenylacetate-CoA ligase
MNVTQAALALHTLRHRTRVPEPVWRELQFRKLSRLLRHAYSNVPYYHNLFDAAGVTPDDVRTLEDVRHIPVTHPETYRSLPPQQRLAAGTVPDRLIARRTSGSTGIPLFIYFTPRELAWHALLTLRAELEVGLRFTDHLTMIDPPGFEHQPRWFEKFGILRKSFVNAFDDVATQLGQLRRLRSDGVVSWASHLRLLAQAAHALGMDDLRFRWAFAHSGPVFDEARELIAKTFGAEVFSRYDTWETFVIGWECERRDGWHIDCDHVLLECLTDNRPTGGPGDVVVTNLDLYATPIIRYALDDVASLDAEPCQCGRTFPRIRTIHGRLSDILRLPGGRCLDFMVLQAIFRHMEAVVRYRVVQESLRDFRLEIVSAPGFSMSSIEPVVARFHECCGSDLSLRLVMRDHIEQASPQKWRYLVSEIPSEKPS